MSETNRVADSPFLHLFHRPQKVNCAYVAHMLSTDFLRKTLTRDKYFLVICQNSVQAEPGPGTCQPLLTHGIYVSLQKECGLPQNNVANGVSCRTEAPSDASDR